MENIEEYHKARAKYSSTLIFPMCFLFNNKTGESNLHVMFGETLLEILERKDEIIAAHERAMERERQRKPNKPLSEALADVLDQEDDEMPGTFPRSGSPLAKESNSTGTKWSHLIT